MSNEPLGIFEELQARAERYGVNGEKIRARLQKPFNVDSLTRPELVNPFMRELRRRVKRVGKPFGTLGIQQNRKRKTWPEAEYGVSIDAVVLTLIEQSHVGRWELFSDYHPKHISRPRQVCIYLIDRYCPDYSLPQLGRIFALDHTTIIHAIKATSARLDQGEPWTADLVDRCHQRLQMLAA